VQTHDQRDDCDDKGKEDCCAHERTSRLRLLCCGLDAHSSVEDCLAVCAKGTGHVVVTNKRVVFRGSNKNVEWALAKLVGLDIDETSNAMVLQVSNRQRSHVLNVDLGVFALTVEASLARFQERPPPMLDAPSSQPAGETESPPARLMSNRHWTTRASAQRVSAGQRSFEGRVPMHAEGKELRHQVDGVECDTSIINLTGVLS
jgi:hypothetical protein